MAIIEAVTLSKCYEPPCEGIFWWRQILKEMRGPQQTLLALKNVNLKVEKGELFGLLGPNGAGRTTFCKIMNALVIPHNMEEAEKRCNRGAILDRRRVRVVDNPENIRELSAAFDVPEVKLRGFDASLFKNLDAISCIEKAQLNKWAISMLRLHFKEKCMADIMNCLTKNAIVSLQLKEPTFGDVFLSVLKRDDYGESN